MPITSRNRALNGSSGPCAGLSSGANPPPISADCNAVGAGEEKLGPRGFALGLLQPTGSSGHSEGPSGGAGSVDSTEASEIAGVWLVAGVWEVASHRPAPAIATPVA